MNLSRHQIERYFKPIVFLILLLPLLNLIYGVVGDKLGANPIEYITRSLGWWSLVLLLATLSLSSFSRILQLNQLRIFRRMFGLFAFFYTSLHFATYLWLDKFFDWQVIFIDFWQRPFITAGIAAFILLIPLAVTSFPFFIRKLGSRWVLLHRLVYIIITLGIVHYWWQTRADYSEPMLFCLIFGVLLLERLHLFAKKVIISRRENNQTS